MVSEKLQIQADLLYELRNWVRAAEIYDFFNEHLNVSAMSQVHQSTYQTNHALSKNPITNVIRSSEREF